MFKWFWTKFLLGAPALATIGDKISWNFSPEKGLLTFYDFKGGK